MQNLNKSRAEFLNKSRIRLFLCRTCIKVGLNSWIKVGSDFFHSTFEWKMIGSFFIQVLNITRNSVFLFKFWIKVGLTLLLYRNTIQSLSMKTGRMVRCILILSYNNKTHLQKQMALFVNWGANRCKFGFGGESKALIKLSLPSIYKISELNNSKFTSIGPSIYE